MPLKTTDRDTLAYRLANILKRLNDGEKLVAESLAADYAVSLKTIQTDLNKRLKFLDLKKTAGSYHLDAWQLGKLSLSDIDNFAALAGVRGLFPSLSADFLSDVFNSRLQNPLLVNGPGFEDLTGKEGDFKVLQQSIVDCCKVSYGYSKPDGLKTYTEVEPHKLVNDGGIWYLAVKHDSLPKSFAFTKISGLQVLDSTFKHDPTVVQMLEKEPGIWLNRVKTEVVLQIGSEVAEYFRRRSLLAGQVIEKELSDGGLLVSCRIAHSNQLLPTVRHWLPHIRIISPESLQTEMEGVLRSYLGA
jgi:predicted DNA-binding transcriptional regulator YafY